MDFILDFGDLLKEEDECEDTTQPFFAPVPDQLQFVFKDDPDVNAENVNPNQNHYFPNEYDHKKRPRDETLPQDVTSHKKQKQAEFGFEDIIPVRTNLLEENYDEKEEMLGIAAGGINYSQGYEELPSSSSFNLDFIGSNPNSGNVNWNEIDYWSSNLLASTSDATPVSELDKDTALFEVESPPSEHGAEPARAEAKDQFMDDDDDAKGKELLVHKPWYSHGPFILRVICHALELMEARNRKEKIQGIASTVGILREHVSENILEKLSLIKEMTEKAKAEQKTVEPMNKARDKMPFPYFITPCSSDSKICLAAPEFNPSVRLKYIPRPQKKMRSRNEMRKPEKLHLKRSVVRSCSQRKMFFLESQMEQKLLDFGLNVEDVSVLAVRWTNFEKRLWKLESDRSVSRKERTLKSKSLLLHYIEEEKQLIDSYITTDRCVERREIANSSGSNITTVISIHDVMKQKHEKLQGLLKERLNGIVDLQFVDWDMVAKDMGISVPTLNNLTADTLERSYKIGLSDLYTHCAFLSDELEILRTVVAGATKCGVIDWPYVFNTFGSSLGYSPMAIYSTWRNRIHDQRKRHQVFGSRRETVLKKVLEYNGNITKAITDLTPKYGELSYKTVCNKWKVWNPNFTKGSFSINEDAVLVVLLEMLGFKITERDFTDIGDLVPWRYCSSWRNRAELLFREDAAPPFTIEEDRKLLMLGHLVGNQWAAFQRLFENKTRKRLCLRFVNLLKKLETMTLEEYHILYSRRKSPSNLSIPRLQQVAQVIRQVITVKYGLPLSKTENGFKLPEKKITQEEYLLRFRKNAPDEHDLFGYLLTFDLDVLVAAFKKLVNYLDTLDQSKDEPDESENLSSNNKKSNPDVCNRRKFDISDPMSVASALQIRGVSLQPEEANKELNEFEKKIFSFYRMFEGRYRTKKGAYRSGIPTYNELVGITQLRNIVVIPKELKSTYASENPEMVDASRENGIKPVTSSDMTQASDRLKEAQHGNLEGYLKRMRVGRKGPRGPMKKTLKRLNLSANARSRWTKKKDKDTEEKVEILEEFQV